MADFELTTPRAALRRIADSCPAAVELMLRPGELDELYMEPWIPFQHLAQAVVQVREVRTGIQSNQPLLLLRSFWRNSLRKWTNSLALALWIAWQAPQSRTTLSIKSRTCLGILHLGGGHHHESHQLWTVMSRRYPVVAT